VDGVVTVVPANAASWRDIRLVFGNSAPMHCGCQRMRIGGREWWDMPRAERAQRLKAATHCGDPTAKTTSGLIAYVDGEPAGWVAVEPRNVYRGLRGRPVPWKGRNEDRADGSVWAVTCFIVRVGFRRQGMMRILARAAVEHARERGARAIEGYPLITHPGKEISWGEVHMGARSAFADAGFTQVSHPTPRRVVMRIDF
jgi:GNAT superfamily N-acetyltransferase